MTHQQLHETVPWIEIDGFKWYPLQSICKPLHVDITYAVNHLLHDNEVRKIDGFLLTQPMRKNRVMRKANVVVETAILRVILFSTGHAARQMQALLCDCLQYIPTPVMSELVNVLKHPVDTPRGIQRPIMAEDALAWRQMRDDGMSMNQVAAKVGRSRGTIATYTKNGPHLPKNIQIALGSLEQEVKS